MDFDEYEYLENTVENPEVKKLEDRVNGGDGVDESREKIRSRGSKHRSDDDLDRPSKHSRTEKGSRDHDKDRRLRHGSSSRDKDRDEKDKQKSSRESRNIDKEEGTGKERDRGRDRVGDKERDRHRDSDKRRDDNKERRGRENEREGERGGEVERPTSERHHNARSRESNRQNEIAEKNLKERQMEREFGERNHDSRTVIMGLAVLSILEKTLLPFGTILHSTCGTFHLIDFISLSKAFNLYFTMQMLDAAGHGLISAIALLIRENTILVFISLSYYRRKKDKKEEGDAPVDPERDQRTVFAYQITLKADEKDVYEFFSRAGKVRDVRLITDRNTRRSKGVGYIEFYDVMSVPMGIALSGQPLLGHPVMVKPSEAEKNLVPSTAGASSGGLGPYSGGARRLYVGNLPNTIKEDQLRQVFEPFGAVELVQMPIDTMTGNCKGYAFIQFARLEDAKLAQNLNEQLEIAGQVIKVSAVTDQMGMQEAGANINELDDDEGNGLSLNAHSRALLMQKLDRTGIASSINGSFETSNGQNSVQVFPGMAAAGPVPPVASIDTIGDPSECLLLKNMFDPSAEAEPGFDLDIKEDVSDECSKFGKLKHIHVDKNSAGFVYLRFENSQSAMGAQRALHGRWFAGKMITATFMLPHDYEAKFPNSGQKV